MRRSAQVAAPILASTALAFLSGCHQPEMQRCVDENNKVVDDKLCANLPQNGQQPYTAGGHSGGGVFFFPYHYYYGGYGGRGIGSVVSGGNTVPTVGHTYSTTRGGFGRTFSAEGAHGSSGGSGE